MMTPSDRIRTALNTISKLQSDLLILLAYYEADQDTEAQTERLKVVQPVWSSDSSGQQGESVVYTDSGSEIPSMRSGEE